MCAIWAEGDLVALRVATSHTIRMHPHTNNRSCCPNSSYDGSNKFVHAHKFNIIVSLKHTNMNVQKIQISSSSRKITRKNT
jgi:hypothetical protein